MNWLNKIVDEVIKRRPDGEILIESGASPSGTYHFGHLREIITCDAILLELQRRGRQARHVQFADDLDALRKIPVNIPPEYEKYLGIPLCDIPAPDGSKRSYADYFLDGFVNTAKALGVEMEVIRSHEKYRSGFFVPAIERALEHLDEARQTLEEVSGRKLGQDWSPIQVMEDGYLKNRQFLKLDEGDKTVYYLDKDGKEQSVSYAKGEVKLDWRLDWPARWWLLKVDVEPAGRDHSSSGGSFDTGLALLKKVYDAPTILPVPYDFINRAGDPKKMSASRGTGISVDEVAKVLPPEVVRFFMLRYSPDKRLYFDEADGTTKLIDEFAELLAKPNKTSDEQQLIDLCLSGIGDITVSNVPFSHLVASYQSALRDPGVTIDIIKRTEHANVAGEQEEVIKRELKFIDEWLKHWAPEDVKFELAKEVRPDDFNESQKQFLTQLADKIEKAPPDADGEWFHEVIYSLKDSSGLEPKALFQTLYKALIGKDSGPRAGWFLSILPRDWLIERLKLEK